MTERRILITGASSGIGRATALALARDGNRLALVSRSRESLEDVARAVEARGGHAVVHPADLTDPGATDAAVTAAARDLGGLDVVVSNAGALAWGPFDRLSADDFDRTVAVTFGGAVSLTRAALPHLKKSRGGIVYVGSIVSQLGIPEMSPYVAAKHALRGFALSLALEVEEAGIDVSYVKPGHISTTLWENSTSATGEELRLPPLSYRVEEAVQGILSAIERPRREITIGGAARAQVALFEFARPVYDLVARPLSRLAGTGRQAPRPGLLWEPVTRPQIRASGTTGRPSLLGAGRRLLDRIARTASPD